MCSQPPTNSPTTRTLHLKGFISCVDPGLLLVLALGLIAALPFLTRPGLPRGTDAELHVFRAAELGYSLRAGVFYPRWAPDFYYGYGYPIFNYYAPFTYYLANGLALLPGLNIVGGVKWVFVLGILGAGLGTYFFVRDWLGPRAGLLSAALYTFAPYLFFIDPHMRGDLAEAFSLGIFPLALWAYRRLLVGPGGRRRYLVAGTLLQAVVVLSHNLMALVFTAMLLAYLLWESFTRLLALLRHSQVKKLAVVGRRWAGQIGPAWLALVLGLGLSAIFWLPVMLERDAVHLTLTGPGHFDFHNHFLSLGQLLAPTPSLDLGAAAPKTAHNLGPAQWLLALPALLALAWGPPARRRLTWFFGLCAAFLIFLMLPGSTWLWETVPFMEYLQFPWRLLGPTTAVLAICAGAGYALIARRSPWGTWALALGLGLTLWLALPAMFPPMWEADFGPTDPWGMLEFELQGIAVGTTATGDFLPKTVETPLHPEPAYLATYRAGSGVDKVNRPTVPPDTTVQVLSHGPTHDRFLVDGPEPFVLRLFTLHFPGWRATIDGQEVPIEVGKPEGFITLFVPAGRHEVSLCFGTPPPRSAGTLISLVSLAALAWFAWRGRGISAPGPTRQKLDRRAWLAAGLVAAAFFGFKTLLVDHQHDWFRRTSPRGEVLGVEHSLQVNLGHQISLLGYDLPSTQVRSGGELRLTLYWLAQVPPSGNYQSFAHLTRPVTHLWGQSDTINPGEVPTTRWPLDKYVRDEHSLSILPGTPPGKYQLTVGLYTRSDGRRLPVFDPAGALTGDTVALPTPIQVIPPRRPPKIEDLGLTREVQAGYAAQVTLLGISLPDAQIELPGFVHLALLWRAERDAPTDMVVSVQLLDGTGQVVQEIETRPVDGYYPTTLWRQGEIVRDMYSFWLTETVSPGSYALRVRPKGPAYTAGWMPLGQIEVSGP